MSFRYFKHWLKWTSIQSISVLVFIRLHKSKVYLSNLIPAIAATDSDAELVIAWTAGKKNINLRCLKGVIFVNNKKINTVELYDEDIEIFLVSS